LGWSLITVAAMALGGYALYGTFFLPDRSGHRLSLGKGLFAAVAVTLLLLPWDVIRAWLKQRGVDAPFILVMLGLGGIFAMAAKEGLAESVLRQSLLLIGLGGTDVDYGRWRPLVYLPFLLWASFGQFGRADVTKWNEPQNATASQGGKHKEIPSPLRNLNGHRNENL
jgi:hypothetical protein